MTILFYLGILIPFAYASFIIYFTSDKQKIDSLFIKLPENNTYSNLVEFRAIATHCLILFAVHMILISWFSYCEFYLKDRYILLTTSCFYPIVVVYTLLIYSAISKLALWLSLPLFIASLLFLYMLIVNIFKLKTKQVS